MFRNMSLQTMNHRAILICPHMQTVCEVYIASGLEGMYYALGKTDAMFSGMVECVNLGQRSNRGVDAWIDEEANLSEGRPVFKLGPHTFAGSVLLLDNDGEGETIGTELDVPRVESMIEWTDLETSGDFSAPHEESSPHGFVYVMGQPIYRERA